MPLPSSLADIAQKSAVLFLAGTTVYYMVNVGMLVNRRMELKKQGKLEEELARLTGISSSGDKNHLHAETATTPTPMASNDQPGCTPTQPHGETA
ncbi:hypothetical protein BDB00DRAFT_101929 [Zychaea mexicana]|uniref:uncharacterized protein n=1 Tax=Zychaea mexicana TaxID=64656 RepID=UPI0022FE7C43|nr:uncharacterized protein BDB00DRAFT_101929 [Zychaea mexicana]KAI9496656.1 hypothetical protein BDB00DRAFT_101929 [Zychaea mexicana]